MAEEAIKATAYCLGLLEVREAKSEDRWSLRLLDKVALRLVDRPGRMVYDDWDHAYFLRVPGFHEVR